MRRYSRHPQTVDAAQWDGTAADAQKLCTWARRMRAGILTGYHRDPASGQVLNIWVEDCRGWTGRIFAGEFLLWTDRGLFRVMKADEFSAQYTELEALQTMS